MAVTVRFTDSTDKTYHRVRPTVLTASSVVAY